MFLPRYISHWVVVVGGGSNSQKLSVGVVADQLGGGLCYFYLYLDILN